jgi:protocatechuate 3,4-dioxygenase beta subunit
MNNNHEPEHKDEGSLHDLILSGLTPSRRRALGLLGGGLFAGSALAACGGGSGSGSTTTTSTSSSSSSSSSSSASSSSSSAAGSCVEAADNTNGPYPADGTNSVSGSVVNILTQSGVERSDITTSFGSYSGTAAGVPLTLTITLEDYSLGCAPLAGYAIYIWHCNRDGKYSLYTVTDQNYLRGVQETDANGQVTFTTIFPACYSGRMPHIHVEIYDSLANATVETKALKVTQLAFDRTTCETVYNNASGYSASVSNLAAISFSSDNVFSSDSAAQLSAATVSLSGDYSSGFTGNVTVAVA